MSCSKFFCAVFLLVALVGDLGGGGGRVHLLDQLCVDASAVLASSRCDGLHISHDHIIDEVARRLHLQVLGVLRLCTCVARRVRLLLFGELAARGTRCLVALMRLLLLLGAHGLMLRVG